MDKETLRRIKSYAMKLAYQRTKEYIEEKPDALEVCTRDQIRCAYYKEICAEEKEKEMAKIKEEANNKNVETVNNSTVDNSTQSTDNPQVKSDNSEAKQSSQTVDKDSNPQAVNKSNNSTGNIKQQQSAKSKTPISIRLEKAEVDINGVKRFVGIAINDDMMYGAINGYRFTWKYQVSEYPVLEIEQDNKGIAFARMFIQKRLLMDNVKLKFKTIERNVNYIHMGELNGVWCNVFENGYIRGQVDGTPFTWLPSNFKHPVAVTKAGFKGEITCTIDSQKIRCRLYEEGFENSTMLMEAIKLSASVTVPTSRPTYDNPFAPKGSINSRGGARGKKASAKPSTLYVYVVHNNELTIRYHSNRFITGEIDGQAFSWCKQDGRENLPIVVREAIKSQGFTMLYDLIRHCNPILNSNKLEIINQFFCIFKQFSCLHDTLIDICKSNLSKHAIQKILLDKSYWAVELLEVHGEDMSYELNALETALEVLEAKEVI